MRVFPKGTRFAKLIATVVSAVCWPLSSNAAELTLAWDPPSDGITTGYILFYGTASHSYSEQVDVGNTTSYAVKNLLGGTTYYFAVRAYDATGVTSDPSTEVFGTTAPAVPPVVTALTLSANVASPQLVGTTVTWFSTATGGVAPYQFQWALYEAGRWTVLPWTTASTWTWTPSTPGNDYQVTVAVRSDGSSSTDGEMQQSLPFTVIAPLITTVTMQANVVSPQIPGSTILWSATASGGAAPYQYRWWLYNGNVWSAATEWTTSSTWSWTPTVANGAYLVGVLVRGAGNSTDAPEVSTYVPFPIAPFAPLIPTVTIQANVVSPQIPGSTILWSATASGGAAPYQYRWWVYNGNVWSAATEWTTSSTWPWTPTVANGAYLVGVWVRGAGNSTDAPEVSTYVPFPIAPQ